MEWASSIVDMRGWKEEDGLEYRRTYTGTSGVTLVDAHDRSCLPRSPRTLACLDISLFFRHTVLQVPSMAKVPNPSSTSFFH